MATAQVDRYMLGGKLHRVDPATKLGQGQEGIVIAHPDDPRKCLKLFHPPDAGVQNGALTAAYNGKKVQAVIKMDLQLPRQFVLPLAAVLDAGGKRVIGFVMSRVPATYHKLLKLTNSTFRTDHSFGLSKVSLLFADFFDDLALIHGKDLVVGDVNMGCVMFDPAGGRQWVDTSGWGYPGYPGMAITELFAHPDLYVNLDASTTQTVIPLPKHDRFAFTVAYTMLAIPGAHPFRMGNHPRVLGLPNRARAGVTIFDPDVKSPFRFETLSDELLHEIIERLKRHTEGALDPDMLRRFASEVRPCPQCGTEYHQSRANCPKCQQVTSVLVTGLVSYLVGELFKAKGTLLFAQFVGGTLYLVCRVGNQVQVLSLDGAGVVTILTPSLPSVPGARYRFFGSCLAVCEQPNVTADTATIQIYRISGGRLEAIASTTTGVLQGEGAVFDTSSRYLYRTAGNTLLRSELFGVTGTLLDTNVGTVYQQQSWFGADHSTSDDREVVLGYDRAFRTRQWFLTHSTSKGSRQYQLGNLGQQLDETVDDFAVYFSRQSVLLVMQISSQGRDYVRYVVIGLDGFVHKNELVDAADATYPLWSQLRGKLHQGGSVLHVTPDGIVKQSLADGSTVHIRETAGRVGIEHRLLRLEGRVGIVSPTGILTLAKK